MFSRYYGQWSAHILSRSLGALLLLSAWRGAKHLCALLADRAIAEQPMTLLLAALLFVSASLGAMFAFVGPDLWRPVQVSDRWA